MTMMQNNIPVLHLSGWTDDDIPRFLNKAAVAIDAILLANSDVMLRFTGDYVSPALAVPLLFAREKLSESKHTLYFSRKDLVKQSGAIDFFRTSGIYQALQKRSKETIRKVLQERGGEEFCIWNVPAQANSIIPNETESKLTNEKLSSHALDLVLSLKGPSSITSYLYTFIMELFENARVHGSGSTIYTIAQNARNGDHMIIVYDNGIGIPGAFRKYQCLLPISEQVSKTDTEIVEWAFRNGTSTKQGKYGIPRGMGLPTLKRIADNLSAEFGIASGNGIYYYKGGSSTLGDLSVGIQGTILMLKAPKQS